MKQTKMKRNVRLYYLFRVFATMNFVMPMFMLFLLDKGLSGFEIFVTQAVYTFTELLLTVPSGAFADKVGRKKTLLLSSALYAVCFVLYGMSGTFMHVLLVEVLWAVSSASFHGTGEAFLYDTLAEARQKNKYKDVVGTAYAIQSFMMGACAVAGGYLAKHDLALPFFVSAVPAAVSLVPLLFLDEPRRSKTKETSYMKLVKEASAYVFKHHRLRNVMYYVGVTTLAGFMGWMLYQPTLSDMGLKVEYLGVVMMVLCFAHAVGNKLAHKFEKVFGHLDLMFVFAGVKGLLYLLVYLASGHYLVLWALFADLLGGMSNTLVSDWVNKHSSSKNRATVLSVSTMSGSLMFSVFSPLLGLYVDTYSAHAAYSLLGLMLVAYALRQVGVMLLAKK